MLHYVTRYYELNDEVKSKPISKDDVTQFVEEHKKLPYILVVDPKNRTSIEYEYGKITS